MNNNSTKAFLLIGIFACFLFFGFDALSDLWFGQQFPNYDWQSQSISYLGQKGSPVEGFVTIWQILFSVLLLLFANAFRLTFKNVPFSRLAIISIAIYALGEGIGSGLFPNDPPLAIKTWSSTLHNVFSSIGDAGIIILPFILMAMPYFKKKSKFINYFKFVIIFGVVTAGFFLYAKYFPQYSSISKYKGIWQRIYTMNYHFLLLILNFQLIKIYRKNRTG